MYLKTLLGFSLKLFYTFTSHAFLNAHPMSALKVDINVSICLLSLILVLYNIPETMPLFVLSAKNRKRQQWNLWVKRYFCL